MTETERKMSQDEYRAEMAKEYAAIRRRAMYERFPGRVGEGHLSANEQFNRSVREYLDACGVAQPMPHHWVEAAKRMPCRCGRCAGTGMFITMVENGQPKGPGGQCFRCGGKGFQTDEDARRNYGYDNYGVRIY